MEFPINFGPENIIEAKKATKNLPDCFTFVTNYGNYQVDIQISFLLSKTVRNIIYSDRTNDTYKVSDDSFNKEFLDLFFSSISKNQINIPTNFFKDFVLICQKLQMNCFQQQIDKAILCILYDPISTNQELNDEQKFSFLCENIDKLDIQNLKIMPDSFIYKLITNSKFKNEDEHALYIIKNIEFLGIEYFEQLQFDDLSKNVISQIISILEREENSGPKKRSMQKLMNRIKYELSRKNINLLNISIYVENVKTLDFDFLLDLNKENKKFTINYNMLYENEVEIRLKTNKDFLKSYDIIVLGGIDAFGYYSKCIQKTIYESLNRYRIEGGIVLTLHDVAYENLYSIFESNYQKILGYTNNRHIKNYDKIGFFKKATFDESSGKDEIMSFPFQIEKSFVVSETHQTLGFDPKYVVIWSENKLHNYYTENLEENFADCVMCHTNPISQSEKKFFYNAICHLYDSCHNHIPK